MTQGIWAELIKWDAVLEDEEAVRFISVSDNLDQVTAMPDHEMEYLLRTWETSKKVQSTVGKTRFDQVQEVMQTLTAGVWSQEQLAYVYNFAVTIDTMQMTALKLFHFHNVNASRLRIDVSFLGTLAEHVPLKFPWGRCALVAQQYMSDPQNAANFIATGSSFIAKGIDARTVQRLKGETDRLAAVELLLASYLEPWFRDKVDMDYPTAKTVGTFLTKMGELLISTVNVAEEKGKAKLARCEQYIRQRLPGADEQPALTQMTRKLEDEARAASRKEQEKSEKNKKGGPCSQPSMRPPVEFKDGEVVVNAESTAADRGMGVGTKVRCQRKVAEAEKGETGIIVEILDTAQGRRSFQQVVLNVNQEGGEDMRVVPLSAVVLFKENNEEQGGEPGGQPGGQPEEGGQQESADEEQDWQHAPPSYMREAYLANVTLALQHLNAGMAAMPDVVRVSKKGVVTAKVDIKARGVTLVPSLCAKRFPWKILKA